MLESRSTEQSSSRTDESESQTQKKQQSSPKTSSLPSKSLKSPPSIDNASLKLQTHNLTAETKGKDRTRKAKYLRLQRRIDNVALRINCSKEEALEMIKEKSKKRQQQSTKSYEDYFKKPDNVDKPAHKLEVRWILIDFKQDLSNLYFSLFILEFHLQIKFVSTCKEHEHVNTFQTSHKLYEKYQVHVHHDDPSECTSKQFKRFLIDNPFEV